MCDASALVALLVDSGPDGRLVTATLVGAAQAHADLLDLAIEQWPYELLASRVWALRRNLSSYDASYVALAELIGAMLITLDRRIARAPDVRCTITTP